MSNTLQAKYQNYEFTDADVCNPDDYVPNEAYNPHNVRPFVICNEYGVLAIAFADCMQDALDIAADADKLKGHAVSAEDYAAMSAEEQEELSFLGNASEPYSIPNIHIQALPNPPFSFVALFNAANVS